MRLAKSLCFEVAHYVIDWVKFGPFEGERSVCTVCIIGDRTGKLTRRYHRQAKWSTQLDVS